MLASLWLSGASPLFVYSPAAQYFNTSAASVSWLFGLNEALPAANNSFASTTGPSGVILPDIYASSLTPIFQTSPLFSVNLAVNSDSASSWTSGQISTQSSFGSQSYLLNVRCATPASCSDQPFEFLGGYISTEFVPTGVTSTNVTLDDASPAVVYSGFTPVSLGSQSIVSIIPADYSQTLSMTSKGGATAAVMFIGSAIGVKGVVGPAMGMYKVTLDGNIAATLNATKDVTVHDVILFFTTNLDSTSSHTLILEAVAGTGGQRTGLVIDKFVVYGPSGSVGFIGSSGGVTTTIGTSPTGTGTAPPTNSTGQVPNAASNTGSPSAGTVIGAILGSLAGAGLLIYIFRRVVPVAKVKAKTLSPWDQANNLQKMKNEEVHVTTAVNQRYVYPGLIAHSNLKSM